MLIFRISSRSNRCCIVIVLFGILIGVSSCYNTGHPMPQLTEVYEAKDPETNESILRIIAVRWTGGYYPCSPYIKFRQPDGSTWNIRTFSNDPNYWEVVRIHPEKEAQEVTLEKIHTSTETDKAALMGSWLDFDKSDKQNNR